MSCNALDVVTPERHQRSAQVTLHSRRRLTLCYTTQRPYNIIELLPLPESIPNRIILEIIVNLVVMIDQTLTHSGGW